MDNLCSAAHPVALGIRISHGGCLDPPAPDRCSPGAHREPRHQPIDDLTSQPMLQTAHATNRMAAAHRLSRNVQLLAFAGGRRSFPLALLLPAGSVAKWSPLQLLHYAGLYRMPA